MKIIKLLERKTPEMREFVKYSRVKKPLYHATTAEFEVFDIERSDLGPHFGTDEQADYVINNRLSGRKGVEPYKKTVLLDLNNPIRLKDEGCFHADCIAKQLLTKKIIDKTLYTQIVKDIQDDWTNRKVYDRMVRSLLLSKGYDGVVYKNAHEGRGDSYIAFKPEQIKTV